MKYKGNRSRPWVSRLISAATLLLPVCLFFGVTTCGDLHTLLLTVETSEKVSKLRYKITDFSGGQVIYASPEQTVTRDTSKPGNGLRVAVEFLGPGHYMVQILARGTAQHFFSADYQVDGVREETAVMKPVALSTDADQDGVPACGSKGVGCAGNTCKRLDCNDKNSKINPFAKEICGDSLDNDCSAGCGAKAGVGDAECVDSDKDGDASDKDCDDKDPCRSSKLKEAAHACTNCPGGAAAGTLPVLPKACLEKLKKQGKTTVAPFCGDGIDQDCSGKDTTCIKDGDCDCYPASDDCDDTNAKVNKGMKELCGDNIDNNCDGNKDEGCIRCDVDGDGYALPGTTDKLCEKMLKTDPDDFDSGIHPGTTTGASGGAEGGTIWGALREWCSFKKLTKNSTTGKPIYERDLDHDGDKLPAKQDGCPSAACDADGDGFQHKSCNPPLSRTDCDDSNPKIFPGAPDKCGDSIVQNCVADKACAAIIDTDKDGYSNKDDCNDSDANAFPWGTERCDGKDNDCDGLIDEGNPDHTGKGIATNVKSCNDDNDGECATSCTPGAPNCSAGGNLLSGICACSSQPPNSARDEQDRVKCSGENLNNTPSPRCFGATQKRPEQCDNKDWDCNEKNDDPTGVNFKDKGKPCSITGPLLSKGTCKTGKVIGCNLSKAVPNAAIVVAVMKKHKIEYNPYWVCSNETLFPIPEVCDGRDDDCDGFNTIQDVKGVDVGSIELDEKDADHDKYMACKGPCSGTGRTALISGINGCDDCDEKTPLSASTHPFALEWCNDWDDNCKNGKGDDGKDECPKKGTGWECCPIGKSCQNTLTNKTHCGNCGFICDKRVADTCKGGQCVCGSSGSACKNGLNCINGACTCISGKESKCSGGCCDGTSTCRFFPTSGTQSASKCGYGGQQCKSCNDGNDCTSDKCTSSGTCSSTSLPNSPANPCKNSSGRCWNGQCCLGCVGGGLCQPGSSVANCGLGGGTCNACKNGTQCKADNCSAGKCTLKNKSSTTCDDKLYCTTPDICTSGVCGGLARNCSSKTDDCNTGTCSETLDTCFPKPKADFTACQSSKGKCYNGACCTGCYDGTGKKCRAGNATDGCAIGGGTCKICPPPTNVCKVATCSSAGVCSETFKGLQAACYSGGKSGQCYNATSGPVCCTGCWDSTSKTCKTGTAISACAVGGYACLTCTPPNDCKTASCSSAGACNYANKSNTTSCKSGKGKCYAGSCCTTCYNGTKCVSGTGWMCGTGGNNCVNCSQNSSGTCSGGVCTCSGCLKSNGKINICYAGTANTLCGASGTCTDCTASSKTCNTTMKACE